MCSSLRPVWTQKKGDKTLTKIQKGSVQRRNMSRRQVFIILLHLTARFCYLFKCLLPFCVQRGMEGNLRFPWDPGGWVHCCSAEQTSTRTLGRGGSKFVLPAAKPLFLALSYSVYTPATLKDIQIRSRSRKRCSSRACRISWSQLYRIHIWVTDQLRHFCQRWCIFFGQQ